MARRMEMVEGSKEFVSLIRFVSERLGLGPSKLQYELARDGVAVSYQAIKNYLTGKNEPSLSLVPSL